MNVPKIAYQTREAYLPGVVWTDQKHVNIFREKMYNNIYTLLSTF